LNERVVSLASEFVNGKPIYRKTPPLWDGKAAQRIVDVFDSYFEMSKDASIESDRSVDVASVATREPR